MLRPESSPETWTLHSPSVICEKLPKTFLGDCLYIHSSNILIPPIALSEAGVNGCNPRSTSQFERFEVKFECNVFSGIILQKLYGIFIP